MNRYHKTAIYTGAVVLTLILIGVGYAFLSSDLSLNGNVNVKKHEKKDSVDTTKKVCKRATALHEEICNSEVDNGCMASGYNQGEKVVYGSLGASGSLTPGDAFDCDVNNDGEYNPNTERFYYISNLDSDNDYVVLIYYNNISNGVPINNVAYPYDKSNKPRVNGPVTLISQLISTSTWSNVSLSNQTRQIKDEKNDTWLEYTYEGKSTRLLTYKEVVNACGNGSVTSKNYLNKCSYLMENTKYTNNSLLYGYWLENPYASNANQVWRSSGYDRNMHGRNANSTGTSGYAVRPAIEVLKTQIVY